MMMAPASADRSDISRRWCDGILLYAAAADDEVDALTGGKAEYEARLLLMLDKPLGGSARSESLQKFDKLSSLFAV
jgi:hypothetical protein